MVGVGFRVWVGVRGQVALLEGCMIVSVQLVADQWPRT